MAFNEDTSFIEYNVEQPTQDFVTNFDTIGGTTDVVLVTVDGVLTDTPESSYTVQQINHTTWRVTPEVQTGSVVRLYRVTDLDQMMHVFTAGAKFIARNMDSNFKQIRHAQQEVRDGFEKLSDDTYEIIDTLQVVGQAAQDAADAAEDAAQTANEAAAQVNDKVSYQDLEDAVVTELQSTISEGIPATAITDISGATQQDLNTIFKNQKLIDTRLYGLKVNTAEDQTAAIHAAFAANPDCSNFYIPKGTIKANIVYPRAFMNLVGDSMLTTIIRPFDLTKPAVSFGKRLYPALTQLSINAGQDFTAEHLLDATDTRYMYLRELDIKKTIAAGETHSHQTILIDQRPITTSWTGYNTLDTVRATYGAYGYLSDVEKLNSVLSMKSCVFAENGYFGIKTNIENGSMLSMDVAGNGRLQPSGTYDESQYGGMYLSGENSVVLGCWSEYNSEAGVNFSVNNIYFHPEKAINIAYNFGRQSRGTNGIKVFSHTQGQLINVSQADRATDDGLGRARPAQLLKNGNFKHFNSASRPLGWLGSFNGTVTQETSDLPNGYNTGIKIVSSAAGITNCIQNIYDSTNIAGSLIKDISKWVGREVTFSFWLKNIGTSAVNVRGGIATDANAYFSDGNYFALSEVGQWRKFICSRKITGTETRISFGFRVTGVGEGVIVTGASASDDCRVLDSQPKAITEDGGEIYGSLEVKGVISQNGDPLAGRPFQTGTNGLQNATSTVNTTDKYVGKFAWNANDSKLYYATGATVTSAWKSIDGVTTITPV